MKISSLHIRPARAEDKPTVIELTKTVWEGHDYLPKVFDEWLADPDGLFFVGEVDGTVVATGKISLLAPDYAWIEGLRVDPEHRGRGYARDLHDFALKTALALPAIQRIGLSTSSGNTAMRRVAEASGMRRAVDFLYLQAIAEENDAQELAIFEPDDLDAIRLLVEGSEYGRRSGGYMADGWQFPPVTDDLLRRLLEEQRVVGYRHEGQPAVVALLGENKEWDDVWLGFLAASDSTLVRALGRALRRRAHRAGIESASVMLPAGLSAEAELREAGFTDWDDDEPFSIYLYMLESAA